MRSMSTDTRLAGVEVRGPAVAAADEILTDDALAFVAKLQRAFGARRKELLARRVERQREIDAGKLPDFLPETAAIRADSSWPCAPVPADLQDRRVEITRPTDRKMVSNALNSGASVFMADFEDANTPAWRNGVEGQLNLIRAGRPTLEFRGPEGKEYRLNPQTATLA